MKPYRFLTSNEKNKIISLMKDGLSQWSRTYADAEIEFQVDFSKPETGQYHFSLENNTGSSLGFIRGDWQSLITQLVFQSEKTEDFAAVVDRLIVELVTQLLGESIEFKPVLKTMDPIGPDDFSHSHICLRLSYCQHHVEITLDPAWAFNQWLKPPKRTVQPLAIDEALAHNPLTCEIRLENFCLPINAINTLKPGDVILTDHALSAMLELVVGNNILARGALGKTNQQKSIKIRRFV